MSTRKTYSDKRSFEETPEPAAATPGDVDPSSARPGKRFVVQQHHARRLHFDLRLEMMNGQTPVLVSWAIPRNLPRKRGEPHLAVHVEDHPIDYATFSGTIPEGNYGAGEVRIFDSGTYELLEQDDGKLTFRLIGDRLRGIYHLNRTRSADGKDEWLAFLKKDERPPLEELPVLAPMLATPASEAFDDEGWMFEPKWDGVRTLAVCEAETVLLSRNHRDVTATYPELSRLHERIVATGAVVDGEIVALQGGRPSFERLQSRINLHNPRDIERALKSTPVTFIAFDVLYLDGRSVIDMPVEQRKAVLDDLIVPSERAQVSTYVQGDGVALSDAARRNALEGIVAKKLGSPYRPGRRTKEWLKIKVVCEADVVVGGWTKGEGSRAQSFGALLVGAYSDEGLRFAGAVGTGFSHKTIDELLPHLRDLETGECPFMDDPSGLRPGPFGKTVRGTHWVEPVLVAKVEFREVTSQGRLRAPSFKGLRFDKDAKDCLFSELIAARGG